MAGHTLKSASITNLDASPIVANTIGEGAPGMTRIANDYVLTFSADDNTSTFRLCRIPTNAKVKAVYIYSNIPTTGSADVDIAFSDSLTDGTAPAFAVLSNPVVLIGTADNKLFGAAMTLVLAGVRTDKTYGGTFTPVMQNLPLWQALVNLGASQFTTDPGGFFDLMIKVTATTGASGTIGGEVWYVE
jgi:hypothetical protein